jgi:hypothetical protein
MLRATELLRQCPVTDYRSAMPTVRKTPQRTVGVDDELWQKAQRKARRRREKVSDVLRRALVEYVDDDDPREAGDAEEA